MARELGVELPFADELHATTEHWRRREEGIFPGPEVDCAVGTRVDGSDCGCESGGRVGAVGVTAIRGDVQGPRGGANAEYKHQRDKCRWSPSPPYRVLTFVLDDITP